MSSCCSSNIIKHLPTTEPLPLLATLLGMLFNQIPTRLTPLPFQISAWRSPWLSYIKQQNPNTQHTSTLHPPSLLFFHSTYHALTYKMFVYCIYLPPECKLYGGRGFDSFVYNVSPSTCIYWMSEWMNELSAGDVSQRGETYKNLNTSTQTKIIQKWF